MDWDRQKIKECLEVLKQLPDFDKLPFPDSWGKEFNIPITPAKILDLNDFLKANKESVMSVADSFEYRPPAEGGVREVKEEEPMTLEIITKTSSDMPESPPPELEQDHQAIESTEIKQLESPDSSPTGTSPQPYDEGCNGHDGQGL